MPAQPSVVVSHFFCAGQYDNTFDECPDADQTMNLTGIGSAIDTATSRCP